MVPFAGLTIGTGGMDEDPNNAVSINLRASLVPAAAVIPAQVAYFDVVAVKKLVVGWQPSSPAGFDSPNLLWLEADSALTGDSLCPHGALR